MGIAIGFLCAIALFAAEKDSPPPKIELPAAVRPIIDLARAAPPEFFAATVVNLIRGGKIPNRAAQIALLEQAFVAAPQAKEPVRTIAIPGTPPDTREIYRGKAGELNLDALSLQSRVLSELVTVDPTKARELFDGIPRPELDPRTCADPLIADDSAYYAIAAEIAQSAFNPVEKKQEAHVQFLAAVLSGAQSPIELAPFAHAIQSVALKPDELQLLLGALTAKLQNIGADYRPFAMSANSLASEISSLLDLAQAQALPVESLREAFRAYLIAQLNAPRCAPDIGLSRDWLDKFAGADQIKPAEKKDSFSVEKYFDSGDSKALAESLIRLRGLNEADRRQQLPDFLSQFAAWQPEGAAIDVFHQKAAVLGGLRQIFPLGEDHERILKMSLELLESGSEREAPAEWLYEVKQVALGPDAAGLIVQFSKSEDAGLKLYSEMNGNF
ncbi:MAG: hypothetical protein ACRD30_10465 [Bryobacteraceae bacterium]